ncbi:hypothetical protein EX461_24345 [Vibrio parahaemolyticus]|nr:hypothetical protein [Vibrio parahaemolyticus]
MVSNIKNIIENNNGFIPSTQLSELIGRNHRDVTRKIKKQFDESTLRNLRSVKEVYNNNNLRDVFLLPEKEAMALTMSYNVNIGMQVYEAFQIYKKALVDITNSQTIEEAHSIANNALQRGDVWGIMKYDNYRLPAIKKLRNKYSAMPIDEFVRQFLEKSANNRVCTLDDRMKTANALRKLVNQSYDNLSAREHSQAAMHELALRLIAEYEKHKATQVKSFKATRAENMRQESEKRKKVIVDVATKVTIKLKQRTHQCGVMKHTIKAIAKQSPDMINVIKQEIKKVA